MRLKEIKPGMVIHCKTEKETMLLCEWVKKRNGFSSTKDFELEMVDAFRNNYCFEIRENCLKTTVNWGGEAVEFSDLIIPDLSPAEVLKICNEICSNAGACNDCAMAGNCFYEKDSDYQKVVEVCEQWKADHEKKEPEKKEPEVEWIWQGRIYEIHDHDKGNFFQLKDGNGFYDTGCLNEESAEEYMEEVLKDYCKDHKGEFIAVVTRVCRVKQ